MFVVVITHTKGFRAGKINVLAVVVVSIHTQGFRKDKINVLVVVVIYSR